jgi:hypothetical protein
MQQNTKTLSVSHIDLDGYGAQFILKEYLFIDEYINLNYGDLLDYFTKLNYSDYKEIFITDLNLDKETALLLDTKAKEHSINLVLIDHHGSGQEQADTYNWYFLNTDYCGAYNTWTYCKEHFSLQNPSREELVEEVAQVVDILDMWRKEHKLFNRSTYLSNCIFDNPIENQNLKREFNFRLIEVLSPALKELSTEKIESLGLSNQILLDLLRDFYKEYNLEFNPDVPLKIKSILTLIPSINNFKLLEEKSKYGTVRVYRLSSSSAQYCFDYLLDKEENQDIIFMNVGIRGNVSVRSRNSKAVEIAKLFDGGGHPDASGAFIKPGLAQDYQHKDYISRKLLDTLKSNKDKFADKGWNFR